MTKVAFDDLKSGKGLGLTRAQRAEYSIVKVIRSQMEHKSLDGLERELHDTSERERRMPQRTTGTIVPSELFRDAMPRRTRDMNVTTFGQGGAFVQTSVSPEYIEVLRNRPVVEALGCRRIDSLQGNVQIPRATGSVTPNSLAEQALSPNLTPALDSILLTPHRVSVTVKISKQLLLQSTPDADEFVKADIMAAMNVKQDYLCLQGQGGAEPTGILNTTGIGSFIFGGTATWAQLVNCETLLGNANVLGRPGNKIGWAISPSTFGRWKQVAKVPVSGSTTFPIFLLDGVGDDVGRCNSHLAIGSNQVINNLAYFGCWSDSVLATWGDLDLITDPYSMAEQATVKITLNCWMDFAVRYAQAFVVSGDAANL